MTDHGRTIGSWSRRITCALILATPSVPTIGQAAAEWIGVAGGAIEEQDEASQGFTVPRAEDQVLDALQDFRRHMASQRWEKAFGVLDEVYEAESHALLPAGDGLYLPVGQQVWDAFVSLPPAGRDAVRLFYDGKAAKLMESAQDPAVVGTDAEAQQLQRIFDRYFVTRVGDDAADRLGDLHFERGRFGEARRCWEAILHHYPDTDRDTRKLEVKRAVALLRLGHLSEFDQTARVLTQRYAGQPVTIAGQAVAIDAYLSKMRDAAQHPDADPDRDAPGQTPLALPDDQASPLWHCPFMTPAGKRQFAQLRSNHWAAMSGVGSRPPTFIADEQRLYLNWLGVVFALDLDTGKIVWRTEPLTQLNQSLQQIGQSNSFKPAQYTLVLAGDTLLTVSLAPQDAQQWNAVYRLMAFDKQTGTQRWTTASISDLQEVQFVGTPLVHGDLVIAATHQREGAQLVLRALRLADGSPVWSLPLGTAQMQLNWRHNQVMPVPRLIARREMVYVMTNNGALLAVDADAQALRWAVTYDAPNAANELAMRRRFGHTAAAPSPDRGTLRFSDGKLLIKEPGSSELLAVDPQTRRVVWRRLLSDHARIVAEDEDTYYLFDPQLIALKKDDRRMKFSASLPVGTQALNAADLGEQLAVFTSHGVFAYRKDNGDRADKFPGYDRGTGVGGAARFVGGRLITLSNFAVTAYALPDPPAAAAAAAADQETP
jgi:outer membrane protein assembly factor BamB